MSQVGPRPLHLKVREMPEHAYKEWSRTNHGVSNANSVGGAAISNVLLLGNCPIGIYFTRLPHYRGHRLVCFCYGDQSRTVVKTIVQAVVVVRLPALRTIPHRSTECDGL